MKANPQEFPGYHVWGTLTPLGDENQNTLSRYSEERNIVWGTLTPLGDENPFVFVAFTGHEKFGEPLPR